ncbi:MAG: zinc-ribbon domain-containing protein [Burkholderiales bacterium]|nr:zinc-ribbon domain-containing protein [Burkholderiales bacterium]
MSLITRCPACGTMFKVVPDQLRISQGWVRCGHCAEVFDASASLQPKEQAAAPAFTAAPTQPPLPPPPPEEVPSPPAVPPEPVFEAEPEAQWQPEPEPQPEPEALPEPQASQPLAELDLDSVSFVRQARRKAFWQRPVVRAALALVVLLLAGVLALQYVVQERDRLAAAEPSLKPVLEALCEPLQCRVGPPRQIEAIVIDSSSFNKLRGDAYRLNFTLKNQSALEVAIPAVELTLTDTQDQAVIRRVMQPRELGASSAVIAPASEWSGSLALSVAPGSVPARITGYRLLAFYP